MSPQLSAERTHPCYLPMVAYETYASALVMKGHGHPLWEPDPGQYAPVELGDVGYLYEGAFVKLFNVSKDIDDPSNRLGLPCGHSLLQIGDVLRKSPLSKAPEYISSEGVSDMGADLCISSGQVVFPFAVDINSDGRSIHL
jgi:hypothetical protein